MIHFLSFPHRKIFLTALVLVVVSTAVLVAQNTPTIKEAAPAETEQKTSVVDEQAKKDQADASAEVPGDPRITEQRYSYLHFGELKGTPYHFPVVPGSKDWGKLSSRRAMIESTLIPEEVLQKMSTDDLFASILDDPSVWNFVAYNSYIEGIKVYCKSPTIQEFFRRPDAGEVVISFYESMDANILPAMIKEDEKILSSYLYGFVFDFVESMLPQPELLNTFTHSQSERVLRQALDTKNKMTFWPDTYGSQHFGVQALLVGKVLLHEKAIASELSKPEVQKFLNDGYPRANYEDVLSVFTATEQFLLTTKK